MLGWKSVLGVGLSYLGPRIRTAPSAAPATTAGTL
jgi:hypothetical protein